MPKLIFVDVKKLTSKTPIDLCIINRPYNFIILLSDNKISYLDGYKLGITQLIIGCIENNSNAIQKFIAEFEVDNNGYYYHILSDIKLSDYLRQFQY